MVSATTSLDHWRKAQDTTSLSSIFLNNMGDRNELWVKPALETIKINVDAASFEQENSYGFGLVVRDHLGSPLHIQAEYHGGYFPSEVTEAMGIKEAFSWIKANHRSRVLIESDSMLAVQAIHSTQLMTSVLGLVVNDCRNILSSLSDVSLRFVRRSANCAAHFVARHARSSIGRSILGSIIPPDLHTILYSEY
ncbi:uncharacterized protein LOC115715132 [Cannabis sativa]|uniref:uncharacterized protein LOC115715132 n=1 Tax=Cannabis sativa TaxID=3483 RepID=UPI0029CA925E|nr:uncharacterized protein LOC115715132 [Cannabis sativa]